MTNLLACSSILYISLKYWQKHGCLATLVLSYYYNGENYYETLLLKLFVMVIETGAAYFHIKLVEMF